MFDSNHPILGSRHADVLGAQPDTEESKAALVEEVKNRARGIFASGNYPEAEILYDKAIQVKPDAILYANRSAVRLNLNMSDAALEDADKAIATDPSYSKAYYRKGQAHNARKEYAQALAAFEKGLELDPSNKTFQDMATKARAAAAKAASVAAAAAEKEATTPAPSTTTTTTTTTVSSSTAASSAPAPAKPKASSKKAGGEGSDREEEEVKVKAADMRGYKTLADGRKTTYFNNELSEEAKRLIGDIAPKKIEPAAGVAAAAVTEAPAAPGGAGGSAWNYAGTFEERNMTEWAKAKLKELLSGLAFVVPGDAATVINVTKVKDLEGDASVTFVRGKKKYLYDFVFTLEWEAPLDGGGQAKGTLKYPDVTPDNDDEYDTLLEVDPLTPPTARHLINSYVKASGAGIQQLVREQLRAFMKEFQTF